MDAIFNLAERSYCSTVSSSSDTVGVENWGMDVLSKKWKGDQAYRITCPNDTIRTIVRDTQCLARAATCKR